MGHNLDGCVRTNKKRTSKDTNDGQTVFLPCLFEVKSNKVSKWAKMSAHNKHMPCVCASASVVNSLALKSEFTLMLSTEFFGFHMDSSLNSSPARAFWECSRMSEQHKTSWLCFSAFAWWYPDWTNWWHRFLPTFYDTAKVFCKISFVPLFLLKCKRVWTS